MNPAKLASATEILKNAGCSEACLSGSRATGKANGNSDMDLGVRGLAFPLLLYSFTKVLILKFFSYIVKLNFIEPFVIL